MCMCVYVRAGGSNRRWLEDIVAAKVPFDDDIVRSVFGESFGSADSIIVMDARCLLSGLEAVGRPAVSTMHLGTHPGWLASVTSSTNWSAFVHNVFVRLWAVIAEANKRDCTLEVLIIVCCKSGVHRSLATGYLMALAIQLNEYFAGVLKMMPVPMATVGSPDDFCQCELADQGGRPCEVCRIAHWEGDAVRRMVLPVVQAEATRAKRVVFPDMP